LVIYVYFQKLKGFSRARVNLPRSSFTYLGIEEGRQTFLVLAWSFQSTELHRHMVTIRALAELVGSKDVPDYRIAADPSRNYAFILCPNEVKTEELRGRYVKVGEEKIFFDVVCYAGYLCFSEDVNQQALVKKMN